LLTEKEKRKKTCKNLREKKSSESTHPNAPKCREKKRERRNLSAKDIRGKKSQPVLEGNPAAIQGGKKENETPTRSAGSGKGGGEGGCRFKTGEEKGGKQRENTSFLGLKSKVRTPPW